MRCELPAKRHARGRLLKNCNKTAEWDRKKSWGGYGEGGISLRWHTVRFETVVGSHRAKCQRIVTPHYMKKDQRRGGGGISGRTLQIEDAANVTGSQKAEKARVFERAGPGLVAPRSGAPVRGLR